LAGPAEQQAEHLQAKGVGQDAASAPERRLERSIGLHEYTFESVLPRVKRHV